MSQQWQNFYITSKIRPTQAIMVLQQMPPKIACVGRPPVHSHGSLGRTAYQTLPRTAKEPQRFQSVRSVTRSSTQSLQQALNASKVAKRPTFSSTANFKARAPPKSPVYKNVERRSGQEPKASETESKFFPSVKFSENRDFRNKAYSTVD